jgi:hypothetical protein
MSRAPHPWAFVVRALAAEPVALPTWAGLRRVVRLPSIPEVDATAMRWDREHEPAGRADASACTHAPPQSQRPAVGSPALPQAHPLDARPAPHRKDDHR